MGDWLAHVCILFEGFHIRLFFYLLLFTLICRTGCTNSEAQDWGNGIVAICSRFCSSLWLWDGCSSFHTRSDFGMAPYNFCFSDAFPFQPGFQQELANSTNSCWKEEEEATMIIQSKFGWTDHLCRYIRGKVNYCIVMINITNHSIYCVHCLRLKKMHRINVCWILAILIWL